MKPLSAGNYLLEMESSTLPSETRPGVSKGGHVVSQVPETFRVEYQAHLAGQDEPQLRGKDYDARYRPVRY